MFVTGHNSKHVTVLISARNLRTMYKALEHGLCPDLCRKQEDGTSLFIVVEPDERHYKGASEERKKGSSEVQRLLETNLQDIR